MSRRTRALSAEERRLWAEIVRQVRPLRLEDAAAPAEAQPEGRAEAETKAAAASPRRSAGPKPPSAGKPPPARIPAPPPLAPLERRMMRALSRGRVGVDASLDLHGLTQQAAHARLASFLRSAHASGHRLVLVVTGRGRADGERGVLRRNVPHWLSLPDLRPVVLGFEAAGPRQGGEGALYVRLRRPRAS